MNQNNSAGQPVFFVRVDSTYVESVLNQLSQESPTFKSLSEKGKWVASEKCGCETKRTKRLI